MKILLGDAMREIGRVVRAVSPAHRKLRGRILTLALLTILLDVLGGVVMYMLERNAVATDINNLGDSFYWTSAQLSTVSSQMANPLTPGGRFVGVLIDFYAITVVATLAGSFSAFFHTRHMQEEASVS